PLISQVFPNGEVNTTITSRFASEKTLFSRVLLHIPENIIATSPKMHEVFSALCLGLIPPVFSRAALGQLYLALDIYYCVYRLY
ncbi:hypothetical protein KIPB_016816, partial [Kipferlia bialata]